LLPVRVFSLLQKKNIRKLIVVNNVSADGLARFQGGQALRVAVL